MIMASILVREQGLQEDRELQSKRNATYTTIKAVPKFAKGCSKAKTISKDKTTRGYTTD